MGLKSGAANESAWTVWAKISLTAGRRLSDATFLASAPSAENWADGATTRFPVVAQIPAQPPSAQMERAVPLPDFPVMPTPRSKHGIFPHLRQADFYIWDFPLCNLARGRCTSFV